MKHQVEQANKDKRKAEDDLFVVKDKLREVLADKITLDNQIYHL